MTLIFSYHKQAAAIRCISNESIFWCSCGLALMVISYMRFFFLQTGFDKQDKQQAFV